jgi:hypothetical protein
MIGCESASLVIGTKSADLDIHLDRSSVKRVDARCWRIVCRDEADRRDNGFDKRGRLLIIFGAHFLVIFDPFYNVLGGCRLCKRFHILFLSGNFPPLVDVSFYQRVFVGFLLFDRQLDRAFLLTNRNFIEFSGQTGSATSLLLCRPCCRRGRGSSEARAVPACSLNKSR